MRSAFDYIKRLLRIEQAKAKERMSDGAKGVENSTPLRADVATAAAFGMKKDTMRRELFIADNADMLDPAASCDGSMGFTVNQLGGTIQGHARMIQNVLHHSALGNTTAQTQQSLCRWGGERANILLHILPLTCPPRGAQYS